MDPNRAQDATAAAPRCIARRACALALLAACVFANATDFAPPAMLVHATGVDIGGEIVRHAHLTPEALAALPHVKVHASAHGVDADWDGVPLIELLRSAGAPAGEKLRGPALALYVRVSAADGHRAVFALAELDPSTGDREAILADRKNGRPLDAEEGPLRVIVPGDKRPARWLQHVVAIDLLRAPDPLTNIE